MLPPAIHGKFHHRVVDLPLKVEGGTAHLANFHLVISNTTIISIVDECYSKSAKDMSPISFHLHLLGSMSIRLIQQETQNLIPKLERVSVTWSFLD